MAQFNLLLLCCLRMLSSPFSFYGHSVNFMMVTSTGLLYMLPASSYPHTQYIAPLKADFGEVGAGQAVVRMLVKYDSVTVQWKDVSLVKRPSLGKFTFQASPNKLYPNLARCSRA